MKYLYDLLSKFIKKKRTAKLVYKIVSVAVYLILITVVALLFAARIKRVGFDYAGPGFILCIAYLLFCLFDELLFKVRYLHVSHNKEIKSVVREYGAKLSLRNPHGKDIFSATFDNDACIECSYDRNVYTFSVKNDEWDEVASLTAGEFDFGQKLKKAAETAASLEKMPDGEYDESLAPETDPDEYDDEEYGEYGYDDDGEEEEEEEDGDEDDKDED